MAGVGAVLGLSLIDGTVRASEDLVSPYAEVLRRALRWLPAGAPITVLVHGYKFSPLHARKDPHRLIFAPRTRHPRPKYTSWPQGLGFAAAEDGLCIGFAWPAADPDHPGPGVSGFHRVYAAAPRAGAKLAEVIATLHRLAPARPVDLFTHSLGARVVLSALPAAPAGAVGSVILMGGAEFDGVATDCLTQGAGRAARVYNVISRDNTFYDRLFHRFGPPPPPGARTLGHGIGAAARNAFDLRLDDPGHLTLLRRRGVALDPKPREICHWSFYTRPGAFGLYREILRNPHNWTLPDLRTEAAALPVPPTWRLPLPGRNGPPSGAGGVTPHPLAGA